MPLLSGTGAEIHRSFFWFDLEFDSGLYLGIGKLLIFGSDLSLAIWAYLVLKVERNSYLTWR